MHYNYAINVIALQICSFASCSHPLAQEVVAKEGAHDCSSCVSRLLGSRRRRRRVVHDVGDIGLKMGVALGRCSTAANFLLMACVRDSDGCGALVNSLHRCRAITPSSGDKT